MFLMSWRREELRVGLRGGGTVRPSVQVGVLVRCVWCREVFLPTVVQSKSETHRNMYMNSACLSLNILHQEPNVQFKSNSGNFNLE